MIYALIAALILGGFLHSLFHDRAHDRLARSTDQWITALTAMQERHEATFTQQAAEHRAELRTLLVHIQAPEIAVIQHQQEQAGPDETQPLTDEEIAELQDRELALERIERMQREGTLT